jgi:hypothetical protein
VIDEATLSDAWVLKINEIGKANTVESAVAIGQLLRAAQTALPRGAFRRLLVKGVLPFKTTMVNSLMRIGAHPLIAGARFNDALPQGWSVLSYLSRVPTDTLEAAIVEGRVTPIMTAHQAAALAATVEPSQTFRIVAPTRPTDRARTRAERDERLERIRVAAAQGATSGQIAAMPGIGLSAEHVRILMRRSGIACAGDKVIGRRQKIKSLDILESILQTATSISDASRLIDCGDLTLDQLNTLVTETHVAQRDTHREFAILLTRLMRERSRKERHAQKVVS